MNARTLLLCLGLLGALPLGLRIARSAEPELSEAYWADGSLKSRAALRDGLRDGPAVLFWRNGQLRAEGLYREDRAHGTWSWYHEDGSPDIERSGRYERGERVGPL